MHVLITTQVFPPEIHPTAVMAKELAEDLVAIGWDVTVACGLPHHPTGQVQPEYTGRLCVFERAPSGYYIRRLWHPTTTHRQIPARAFVMGTQAISTLMMGLSGTRPDVVLSFGGPPLVGPFLSAAIAQTFRSPLVTIIHDIYPDVLEESGKVSNRYILALMRQLETLQYKLSQKIVVLGPRTRDILSKRPGVDGSKLAVVPVWLDPNEILPLPRSLEWRLQHGIGNDKSVILYAGTVGIVSGAEILADVARTLPKEHVLLVVGGGTAWDALHAKQEQDPTLGENLILLPYQSRETLPIMQSAADLSLVTLAPGRGRTSVPSKVQGYMAAGRPVLASVDEDSDTSILVNSGNFGLVVNPGDASAIADGIKEALSNQSRLSQWGFQARRIFEDQFARHTQTEKIAGILTQAIQAVRS